MDNFRRIMRASNFLRYVSSNYPQKGTYILQSLIAELGSFKAASWHCGHSSPHGEGF